MKKIVREGFNIVLIILGIFSAAMGLKGFLLSSHFIDGGVTGVSMLVSQVFGVPLAALILVFNLPFIALGYNQVGNVKTAVKQFDPNAFIIVQAVSDAEGGIIKKADFH